MEHAEDKSIKRHNLIFYSSGSRWGNNIQGYVFA